MALAKKCDRCGKLYLPRTIKAVNGQKINGVMLIERDLDNSSYSNRGYKDFCPDCLDEFVKFMNEEKTDA